MDVRLSIISTGTDIAGHRGQFFARAASLLSRLSLLPPTTPCLFRSRRCEYADAFLAEAVLIIRRTRTRSRRPSGPSGRRRRCARL